MYNSTSVPSMMQAALVETGPGRRIAASFACIRHSVYPRTWVYTVFRRSQGMSSLIAAGSACGYVCSWRAGKTGPGTTVSGPAEMSRLYVCIHCCVGTCVNYKFTTTVHHTVERFSGACPRLPSSVSPVPRFSRSAQPREMEQIACR